MRKFERRKFRYTIYLYYQYWQTVDLTDVARHLFDENYIVILMVSYFNIA